VTTLSDITVREYRPADREAWDRFVSQSPHASCYHQSSWKQVIEDSFGTRTEYLLAEDASGQIVGVLPLALLSSLPFGRFLVSLPYFNYGGICAADPEVRRALLDRAVTRARELRVRHIELRHSEPMLQLAEKTTKVAMRLELPSTSEQLWNAFPSDIRRKVRRPQKEGIVARIERAEALDAFYRVFTVNMRDLGTPVYAKKFFASMLREQPDSTWIVTVYQGEQPLASGFLVGFRESLEIPWVSSLRSHNHLYTNMLLYWTALSFACERGYKVFDFGRSTMGAGTYRFKSQWGATPTQLYWHYWLPNGGALPELNPQNPKFAMAVSLWQKLPLAVANFVGPAIVRSLP
jgi:FemAB-related protein (PEP-CTERM system-associated)